MGMGLGQQGRDADEVIAELKAKRVDDARWQDGRTFGLVFDGGPSVHSVAEQAALMYLHENALNPMAFPSLGAIQNEVVAWTAGLLHGPESAAGFLTSGGTDDDSCRYLRPGTGAKAKYIALLAIRLPDCNRCNILYLAALELRMPVKNNCSIIVP